MIQTNDNYVPTMGAPEAGMGPNHTGQSMTGQNMTGQLTGQSINMGGVTNLNSTMSSMANMNNINSNMSNISAMSNLNSTMSSMSLSSIGSRSQDTSTANSASSNAHSAKESGGLMAQSQPAALSYGLGPRDLPNLTASLLDKPAGKVNWKNMGYGSQSYNVWHQNAKPADQGLYADPQNIDMLMKNMLQLNNTGQGPTAAAQPQAPSYDSFRSAGSISSASYPRHYAHESWGQPQPQTQTPVHKQTHKQTRSQQTQNAYQLNSSRHNSMPPPMRHSSATNVYVPPRGGQTPQVAQTVQAVPLQPAQPSADGPAPSDFQVKLQMKDAIITRLQNELDKARKRVKTLSALEDEADGQGFSVPKNHEQLYQKLASQLELTEKELKDTKTRLEAVVTAIALNPSQSQYRYGRYDEQEIAHKIITKLQMLTEENDELSKMLSYGKAKEKDIEIGLLRSQNNELRQKVAKLEGRLNGSSGSTNGTNGSNSSAADDTSR